MSRSIFSLRIFILYLLCFSMPAFAGGQENFADIKLVAHRGFTLHHPENSLAAVKDAIKTGLHGCEVDLRTTKDGHIVVFHDADLDRTTTCSGRIKDMTLFEAQSCLLKDKQGKPTHQKISTLDEVLSLIKLCPPFELALDIKSVDAGQAAKLVIAHNLQDRTLFFIADPLDVETAGKIKTIHPKLRIVVNLLSWWKIEGLPTFTVRALEADALFASEYFFPRCGFNEAREAGAEVIVYLWGTHNLDARFQRAVRLGAQVVSCDRPDQLLHLTGKMKLKANCGSGSLHVN